MRKESVIRQLKTDYTILNYLIIDSFLLVFICRGSKLYLDTCHRLMVLISCLSYPLAVAYP